MMHRRSRGSRLPHSHDLRPPASSLTRPALSVPGRRHSTLHRPRASSPLSPSTDWGWRDSPSLSRLKRSSLRARGLMPDRKSRSFTSTRVLPAQATGRDSFRPSPTLFERRPCGHGLSLMTRQGRVSSPLRVSLLPDCGGPWMGEGARSSSTCGGRASTASWRHDPHAPLRESITCPPRKHYLSAAKALPVGRESITWSSSGASSCWR